MRRPTSKPEVRPVVIGPLGAAVVEHRVLLEGAR